jgi:putative ubiquitin-RnfH superfamily antitoxin RatB of RatAB toxin-antitoxin module
LLRIEVVFAHPEKQHVLPLEVKEGTTVKAAIMQSGVLMRFPEMLATEYQVGVFSKIRKLEDEVEEGDRIEIYRPLVIDPKVARRARAKAEKESTKNG